MDDLRENLIEILRKTRYEYRRYIAMKDYEKRTAQTDEEFCAVDDSIVGEIPFCADNLIAHGVTVQDGKPLEAFLHPIDAYKGLKAKYLVFKADTGAKVDNCFILRPDRDTAAVDALRTYANSTDNETLAEDIYNWVGKGVPVQEWISVKDRLPENFVSVLGYMTDAEEFPPVRECYTVGNAFFFPTLYDVQPVSHWMPLPEPPKGE